MAVGSMVEMTAPMAEAETPTLSRVVARSAMFLKMAILCSSVVGVRDGFVLEREEFDTELGLWSVMG